VVGSVAKESERHSIEGCGAVASRSRFASPVIGDFDRIEENKMFKQTAIKLLIGASGLAIGALFVVLLSGAALADAERLHIAPAQADVVLVAGEPALKERAVASATDATSVPELEFVVTFS
jgi:hypothetical protein